MLARVPYAPAEDRYGRMLYRRSGRSGLKLPAISLGLWWNFGGDRPLETSRAIVRRAFDLGITHFDLANNYGPPYGSAEETFGVLLAKDLRPFRDEIVVSTKAGYDMWPGPYGEWGSRKYLLASLDQSLQRMGLDYVDIFYSHRFDPETPLYIACLRLSGRSCLVVGGGDVGLEKVEGLLACDGAVTLVAPDAVGELEEYAREGSIRWERRAFEEADLDGRFLAIAATDDTDVNISVYEGAERRAMLVNVVDVPPLCNFILPAIVRSGPLAIAISTAGASPALAKRMKREIAETFGEPYARLAVILNDARGWAKATLPTYQDRKEFFEGIVNGDPDPVELVRQGREAEVLTLIDAAKESHAAAAAPGP